MTNTEEFFILFWTFQFWLWTAIIGNPRGLWPEDTVGKVNWNA